MNLAQIHYIVAIANTGSLSLAARQLGVSQPALSRYLAKLEQECRLELFYREKKKLKPTQAGRIYLEAAYKIISIRQQALSSIRALDMDQQKKQLRIGVTPHQGTQAVTKLYPLFKRRFPQTEFTLFEGYTKALYEAVRTRKTDYLMTTALPDHYGLRALPLFEEELLFSVPVFHNLAALSSSELDKLGEADLEDFRDSPFVLMDTTTTIGLLSEKAIQAAGFQPIVVFQSANGYLVDEMIRSGVGVGLIPRHYAVPSEDVVYFRLRDRWTFQYCVVVREDYELSKEERYLTYLQLKIREADPGIHFCWSGELRALVDEFDMDEILPLGKGWL